MFHFFVYLFILFSYQYLFNLSVLTFSLPSPSLSFEVSYWEMETELESVVRPHNIVYRRGSCCRARSRFYHCLGACSEKISAKGGLGH